MSKMMTVREYIKMRFAELERFADDWPLYLDADDWIQQEDAYNECAREQP
ncbi:hypothetical protein N0387_31355 [Pseudomonas aeruginosa]|nr:hypothetical protein [Pseudomonas aeruginosa]EKU4265757.1 hypothetical protein [Pseudomonas aeruginosa]MBG5857322.1 hypothetical protein [Pseudomonas aeruginosa]MCS7816583.1 hypothetical protein [Pseudomonas aeruginosa]MCS7852942.1 hypothetical protein [Pseudomonas aeruginosa]MCV2495848.1 hypothetical protein [Pseudomonas aeruginosa]